MQSLWQRLCAQLVTWFPRTHAYLREGQAPVPVVPANQPRAAKKNSAKPASKAAKPSAGYVPLRISAAQLNAMQADVAHAVVEGVISAPSAEQWAMIVAKKPITRVFAGAGSGKSATLVLRVLLLLKHLKLPLSHVTVISFTNASCQELRERLVKLCAVCAYPLSTEEAAQLVRTFHSAMGAQARSVWPDLSWFEQLASPSATELEQPLSGLKPAQLALLNQAFARASGDPLFTQKLAGASASSAYRLTGMPKAQPLLELLYQEGSFAQGLGLEVAALKGVSSLSASENDFIEALALFWPHFTALLQEQGLASFDHAFAALTQTPASPAALAPMQHVLIDEFQDISPQILNWLLAVQGRLAQAGQAVSLMAIGDDWQSIYGWRGSSPELFIDFDQLLKRHSIKVKSQVLHFVTNYRCEAGVLAPAQRMLDGLSLKQDKGCVAANPSAQPKQAVRLVEGFDSRTDLAQVVELIGQVMAQDPDTQVLVLSRRNQELKRLKPMLNARWPVRLLSIHRAKGLEAEVAIILDDCQRPLAHPLRNALYQQAGLFRLSYDQAMHDEALRLGYVAMTRAKRQAIWFTQQVQGASQVLAAH